MLKAKSREVTNEFGIRVEPLKSRASKACGAVL